MHSHLMGEASGSSISNGNVEMWKCGGTSTIDWLLRISSRCMETDVVLEDWEVDVSSHSIIEK